MTLATDPNAAARANAAWSYVVQGQVDAARDALRLLDPLQLLQLECHAGRLIGLAAAVFDELTQPDMAGLAAALLTPDCPTLPEGVDGFATDRAHEQQCRWCPDPACDNRDVHDQLYRMSETTWRERSAKR
jgi:hypothetical protein